MDASAYRQILGLLPIVNPTEDDMAKLCPHLTREQAVAAFNDGSGYVACPPLRVRGAFQIVSLGKAWVEETKEWIGGKHVVTGTKDHPPRLDYSYAGRTRASYADGRLHGDVVIEYRHAAEAIQFAEENWGVDLILDDWTDVVEFYVEDPSDLHAEGRAKGSPKVKAVIRIAIRRPWNDLINDHSKSESVLIDEAIVQVTTDFAVWNELKGGRGSYTEFNCAHCGSGLGLSECSGCGHTFTDDHMRCGWNTPLSRKMVDVLRLRGHVFKRDPEIAWKKEAGRRAR